jgi:non-specific serine/threonine protein kinase
MMVEAIEELRTKATSELGRDVADAEWEAGQSLRIEGVLSLALEQRPKKPARRQSSVLSAREIEISRLVADGLSNHAIAERLHLSPRTVENHVFHVLNKLGLDNRTQVATWLLRAGLD